MTYVPEAVLVTSETLTAKLKQQIESFAYSHGIALTLMPEDSFFARPPVAGCHVVAVLSIDNAHDYLDLAARQKFSLGAIPVSGQSRLCEWLRLPVQTEDALALAFGSEHPPIELLRCNGEIALGMVTLGSNPFIDGRSKAFRNRNQSWLERVLFLWAVAWQSVLSLFRIQPFAATITLGDGAPVKTAITGMVALENDIRGPAARLLAPHLGMENGFINALFIAPKSVWAYLSFLKDGLVYKNQPLAKLSDAVSFIRVPSIVVELKAGRDYFIDGRRRNADTLVMAVEPAAVCINVLPLAQEQKETKEITRTDKLPRGDEQLKFIANALPLFTHAGEGDFKDLFIQLREVARPHSTFLTLMVLSAVVASLGLFLSSPAVIIGAMVLAPLMSPIISLAMALLRRERNLLVQSLETIGIGMCLALGTAALVTLLIPVDRITSEIAGRLQPNLLDLGVAIASGIAGAYAYVREDVAKSVSGVAIAVALVPPLCVSGIGIGWMDWQVISGAMLLFLTNLVGISLAAALTFLVLGFSPLERARKGLMFSAALMGVIAIPLSVAMWDMASHWQLEKRLSGLVVSVGDQQVQLTELQVRVHSDTTVVLADVLSDRLLSAGELQQLKQLLEAQAGEPLQLQLTPRILL
ncbi:DUF389 domain-containing protein [Simiduia agarivorans]|uniref:TIGR00341 family protein n=1 Tax=Simiduia agarivorans (strain DSM 21679 / JCM 13881 / BCRC 17597 / SA1) TaxID=1117647 RepID=K4KM25_SIMAS|nr:DUF389 domain-containing protein [Simiduia agarivorans]AFV00210.1 hypothetical protein M5M_15385 [Simiduia agarivorans SA1 = DSM 21679]